MNSLNYSSVPSSLIYAFGRVPLYVDFLVGHDCILMWFLVVVTNQQDSYIFTKILSSSQDGWDKLRDKNFAPEI